MPGHRVLVPLLLAAVLGVATAGCPSGDPADPFGPPDTLVKGARAQLLPLRNRLVHPPPPDPGLSYFGGPVLEQAKVVEVLWGPKVQFGPELGGFYGALTGGEYFDLLAEYGTPTQSIGRGSFQGLIVHTAAPAGATIDDGVIQEQLAQLIHDRKVPENDADTIYLVHFPPGVTITHGESSSCVDFCGYHGSFRRNDKLVPYAVIPDLGGACAETCGGADAFENTTWVASHELVGVVTDPAIGFAAREPGPPLGWFSSELGELADLCQGTAQLGGRWVVQTQWSVKDGRCRFGPASTGSFVVGVSPSAQTVRAGTSATLIISTTATAPGAGTILLTVSDLPEGVAASLDPASVPAGGSAVLTLQADATAPAGTVDITIFGTAGAESQLTRARLTVEGTRPANDFTITATPVSQIVRAGQAVKVSVKTALASGTAETIVLSANGLPDGVTASFTPPTLAAGGSSELTLLAAADAPAGSALVMVTGTARSRTHGATVALDVETIPPINDFMLAAAPASASLTAGQTTGFTVTSAVTSGSAQSLTLAATGLPAGVTGAFVPPQITAGGSSVLTLTAARDAAPATTAFTVSGSAASGTRTTTASVTVVAAPPVNDFGVSVAPASRSVQAGSATTFTVSTQVTSGSPVQVALAISGLPGGVTAAFNPTSVTSGGSATLTISAALDAAVGTAQLTVTGASGTGSHPASASVTVTPPPPPDFTVGVTPPSQTLSAGTSTIYVVTTQATAGGDQQLALTISGLPAGVHGSFLPATVTTGQPSTLTVSADDGSTANATTFTVRAANPTGTAHTATAQVTVTAPPVNDFALTLAPGSATVQGGTSVQLVVHTTVESGDAQSVALSVTGLPAGVTAQLSPASVTAGGSATLTLQASPTAKAAQATFTVSGMAASGTRVTMGALTVTPAVITGLIDNGDFETGTLAGWGVESGKVAASTLAHHGGAYSARVGYGSSDVVGFGADSVLYQALAVPSTGKTTLELWVYPRCLDTLADEQAAYITDEARQYPLRTIFSGGCSNSATWEKHTVDLTSWSGRTVNLYLEVTQSFFSFDNAWMYIDDVTVTNQP